MNQKDYKVKHLELGLLSPETRKSPEKLKQLLADDFFEFNQSGGTSTKAIIIKELPNRPEEKFKIRKYREKILASDTILTHYIADRIILKTGKRRCTLCSSIWQKRNNRWQMIFFQGTPATQ